jgi:hypothetical protein
MILDNLIKKILREATSDSGSRGSYLVPMRPGLRKFDKSQLTPFDIPVSKYDSPLLAFDSYDGKMDETKKQIKKIEKKAEKSSKYAKNHPIANDDDGDNINPFPSKLTEDLAVWFGKKKKPKGSSQPKGPWVDICRKVNGKHPPCGRSDADKGSYPKCRAAGVAGKMSDSEKRSACQQKRRAEKNDPQTGKGQKPVMVSNKKKTNDSMKKNIITLTESDLYRIVKRVLKEQTETLPTGRLDLFCRNYVTKYSSSLIDMAGATSPFETKFGTSFGVKKSMGSGIPKDTAFGDEGNDSGQVTTLEIGVPTDVLKKYLMDKFPNIDFSATKLKNILYVKNFNGGNGACRVDKRETSQDWIDWLNSKNVAIDLDI